MIEILQKDMLYPELKILVANPKTQISLYLNVLVDTGYDGFLTLPIKILNQLKLSKMGNVEYVIADGNSIISPTFEGLVQIPNLSLGGWLVEIDSDQQNQDLILGSKFLQAICLDFNLEFCLDYKRQVLKFV